MHMRRLWMLALSAAFAAGACDTAVVQMDVADDAVGVGEGSRYPFLAADSTGRVVLTWSERTADSVELVRFAVRTPAGRWEAPRLLVRDSALVLNWADFASVVPMDDGRLVGHWLRHRAGGGAHAYDLVLAQSVDGGDIWSAPVAPYAMARPGEHGFVSMLPLPGGGAAVQFLNGSAAPDSAQRMVLSHVVFDSTASVASGKWLDDRVCDCCQTDAAMSARGPVVVYRDRSDDEIRDIAIVRHVDGAWTPPARVHADDWHMTACPVNGPAVAANGERVVVAWFTQARDTARVRVAVSLDGGATFAPPVTLDSGPPALGRVDVALLPGDGIAVTWLHRQSTALAEVRVATLDASGAVLGTMPLGVTDAGRASGFPRMVRTPDDLIVTWTEIRSGSPSRVRVVTVGGRR